MAAPTSGEMRASNELVTSMGGSVCVRWEESRTWAGSDVAAEHSSNADKPGILGSTVVLATGG